MYNKKGQVAVFVIMAIVVIGFLLVIFIRSPGDEVVDPYDLDVEDRVIFDLQNCIDEQLGTAVQIIGLQGGYVNLPSDTLATNVGPVPYGIKNGKNIVPSISFIEKEINSYFELILPSCIDDSNYPDIELDQDFNNIRTIIGSDRVTLSVGLVVSLSKEGSSETVREEVSSEIRVKLRSMRSVAWDIANLHVRAPDFIDITYLTDSGYDVLFVPVGDSLLYTITDVKNEINGVAFSYLIGVE